jgi:hypothetical protein
MAAQPVDGFAHVISDSQQATTLVGSIADLVKQPISWYWKKQSTTNEFKQKLGEWAGEAIDDKGRWLQPVLRSEAFEAHLVRENGYFQPTGSCESSFAWAQLLFALNIRPKSGVLAWRLPPKAINPVLSNDIALEVDGDGTYFRSTNHVFLVLDLERLPYRSPADIRIPKIVICHIINLYRLYSVAAPRDFSPKRPDFVFLNNRASVPRECSYRCRFLFGHLFLDQSGDKSIATFEPGTNNELSSQKVPFCSDESAVQGPPLFGYSRIGRDMKHLNFERETLVITYFNAIRHRISDMTNGVLPDPKETIKKEPATSSRA